MNYRFALWARLQEHDTADARVRRLFHCRAGTSSRGSDLAPSLHTRDIDALWLGTWHAVWHAPHVQAHQQPRTHADSDGTLLGAPPLIRAIAKDPVLSSVKLIAEPWDCGGYQVGSFPNWDVWAEWNGIYRDVVRRFVKGDEGLKSDFATRISGSADLYHNHNRCAPPALDAYRPISPHLFQPSASFFDTQSAYSSHCVDCVCVRCVGATAWRVIHQM